MDHDHLGGIEVISALRRLLLWRISRNRILESVTAVQFKAESVDVE